jgi:hypothetical protein
MHKLLIQQGFGLQIIYFMSARVKHKNKNSSKSLAIQRLRYERRYTWNNFR